MLYMRCDFCSMKFLYVIARVRLGISGCIPLRTALRDSFASKDLTISFRCVLSVLHTCVRGEHGKFVSGGTQSIE